MHPSRPFPVWSVGVAAALAASAVWVLAVPLGGVRLVAGEPAATVTLPSVVVVAVLATVAAWGVRTVLLRAVHPARRVVWWRVICLVTFGVSLLGPVGAASLPALGALLAMHVSVGAAVLVGLDPRRAGRRAVATGSAPSERSRPSR